MIRGMNHVLKIPAAGEEANRASYNNPDLPLAGELVTEVVKFVH